MLLDFLFLERPTREDAAKFLAKVQIGDNSFGDTSIIWAPFQAYVVSVSSSYECRSIKAIRYELFGLSISLYLPGIEHGWR